MKKLCIFIFVLFPLLLYSQVGEQHIDVHLYPHSLTSQDSLQDGPFGKNFDIREDTFLVWVDMFPGMFFAHKTAYILISKGDIRIERGDWWPVLNGKMILHNEHDKYALVSPFELPLISANGFIDERIDIHVYPHELTSQDQLTDGPAEQLFKIDDNCLLIWIDLLPAAYFAHPTAYILISKESIRAEHGNWWPMLNSKRILYGERNKTGIISPFKVSSADFPMRKSNKREIRSP
ncbi:MAG: hypothetical protein JSV17_06745 [Candidatus Aminicenantes bacterium]|nr:MAG: hypothetical protein JSV17_06745 [Candidatus Aminicenantes bacterium]